MEKNKLAIGFHDKGCNCAQSVVLSYADEIGIDEKTLFRLTEGFGFGMGCGKGTCGALSGASAVISALSSSGSYENITKKETYEKCGQLYEKFFAYVGTTVCYEIKEGTISCPSCIEYATSLVDDYLKTSSK